MNRRLVSRRLLLLFQLRWWLRLLRREAWRGLVASGVWYGTVGPEILPSVLPGGDVGGPPPGHPERLVAEKPPTAQESVLWVQLTPPRRVGASPREP